MVDWTRKRMFHTPTYHNMTVRGGRGEWGRVWSLTLENPRYAKIARKISGVDPWPKPETEMSEEVRVSGQESKGERGYGMSMSSMSTLAADICCVWFPSISRKSSYSIGVTHCSVSRSLSCHIHHSLLTVCLPTHVFRSFPVYRMEPTRARHSRRPSAKWHRPAPPRRRRHWEMSLRHWPSSWARSRV
jgi:hypothetical protein